METLERALRSPDRPRSYVDVGVTVVALTLTLPASMGLVSGGSGPLVAGFVGCAPLLTGCVVLRRRQPWWAFCVGSVAMLGLLLLPNLPEGPSAVMAPLSLLYLLLVYTLVAESDASVFPLAVSAAGLVLIVLRTAIDPPDVFEWRTFVFFVPAVVLAVGFSWALGAYHRTRRRYVESLEDRARQAETLRAQAVRDGVAREREQIAREVHDVVAHSLAVVVRQSDAALMILDQQPSKARSMVEAVLRTGREAMGELHGVLTILREDDAPEAGHAPVRSLEDVVGLVESFRRDGLAVKLSIHDDRHPVGPDTARAAYRIVQEGLTNALKHAQRGVRCEVRIDHEPDGVVVTVSDDGPGIPDDRSRLGHGLVGMQERARQLDGRLEISSSAEGTVLTAWLGRS